MPSILNLKFKGNKSFVAFSNLNDTESLTKTWKVCTKVASYLEQGQRLENLSWRLWHLQNLMVDTDNAKSKREFKKLSKCMGDKLDKEKGRSIEELEAPDFKRNHSTDMIRQRAVEKERNREASQNAQPGTIKRMQFTFSVDQHVHQVPSTVHAKRPDTKPSAEFSKRTRAAAARVQVDQEDTVMSDVNATTTSHNSSAASLSSQFLHFPPLFSTDFGPSALLYAAPTLTNAMTYGEGFNPSGANESFSISRPTIELPLDEILFGDDSLGWPPTSQVVSSQIVSSRDVSSQAVVASSISNNSYNNNKRKNSNANSTASQRDVLMQSNSGHGTIAPIVISPLKKNTSSSSFVNKHNIISASSSSAISSSSDEEEEEEEEEEEYIPASVPASSSSKRNSVYKNIPPLSQTVKEVLPETVTPSRLTSSIYGTRSNTPTARPHLTVRTQGTVNTRSSGPGATATSLNPAVLRATGSGSSGSSGSGGSNSAPGGVKAECSNCGATHTPLWRRGLNDELNCNACGLYCKLHKRPRPKTMRNSHGEGRAQVIPRQETVDVVGPSTLAAQCYNCHTTATPLWRKDDEGKTVCNACGLYYKLHGSARPISMKSDVIRKRSRHDARRASINGYEDTPSTSPSPSRRASPVPEASPTLAPDSTTQLSYDFGEDPDSYRTISTSSASELMGALGGTSVGNHVGDTTHGGLYQAPSSPYSHNLSSALASSSSAMSSLYPGPYHPDYLTQMYNVPGDALPFSSVDSVEIDGTMSPRSNKRRRMSTDSAEEPPSSAVSFASYNTADGGYSSGASSTSRGHSHSLSLTISRGHTFSLSHNHSHSLSSHVHSHSLSHSHGHTKRSSMEFPFTTYNANGTINSGPVLRGSGNTFWHPPMLPQSGSDSESHLFNPRGSNSTSSSNSNSNSSNGNDGGSNGGGQSTSRGGNNEDSAMDYLPPAPMLQDEDSLFSAYVHPPMALPEDVGQSDGGDSNMHTSMYVDSYYR